MQLIAACWCGRCYCLSLSRIEPLAACTLPERVAWVARRDGLTGDIVVPGAAAPDAGTRAGVQPGGVDSTRGRKAPAAAASGLVLLMRTKARPDKHLLSNEERWRIVRGAFATRPGSQVDNKRVLLVDDVMTTGATLDACSNALLEAGAKSVIGLTVARAVRRETPSGIGE